MAFAVVDISVTANDELSSQQAGRPSTSSPKLRNAAWKRGACWLAIGLLTGTANALMRTAIDEKDAGTVSQPVPVIWIVIVIYFFHMLYRRFYDKS